MNAVLIPLRIIGIVALVIDLGFLAAGLSVLVRCARRRANGSAAWAVVAAAAVLVLAALHRVIWVWGIGTFWSFDPHTFFRPLQIGAYVSDAAMVILASAILAFRAPTRSRTSTTSA